MAPTHKRMHWEELLLVQKRDSEQVNIAIILLQTQHSKALGPNHTTKILTTFGSKCG